jgi:RNA polymerase sigma-70 factor (ECF subfamily)
MYDHPRHLSEAEMETLLAQRGWVQRLARSLIADVHRADDVAQASWLSALRHPPRHASNLRSWLSMLVRNTARKMQRSEVRREHHERETFRERERESEGAGDALERAELAQTLGTIVLSLREPYRSVLVLAYFDGLAPSEIGERIGVSASTVRTQIQRGLALVKTELERKHGRERWLPALIMLARRPDVPLAIGGVAIMSLKLKTALVAVVVACLGLWLWQRDAAAPSEPRAAAMPVASAVQLESKSVNVTEPSAGERSAIGGNAASVISAQSSEGSLRIEVVWERDGSPAANVGVLLTTPDAFGHSRMREGTTDPDGVLVVDHLQSGYSAISIDRGGSGRAMVEGGKQSTARFTVPLGVHVRGMVVDLDANPVPGASVWLSYESYSSMRVHPMALSDPAGRFEIDSVEPRHFIAARKDGLAPSCSLELGGRPGETVEVQISMLGPGGSCAGVVLADDGKPVADAEVWIGQVRPYNVELPHGHRGTVATARRSLTDKVGLFRVDDLALGENDVAVAAAGFARQAAKAEIRVGEMASIEIQLGHGAVVHGIVQDPEGLPAANVKVEIDTYGTAAYSRVRTDTNGAFRIEGVPAGKQPVTVDGGSHGRLRTVLEVHEGEDLAWNVTLDRGIVIGGRVLDENERPLEGWIVSAQPTGENVWFEAVNRLGDWMTKTDADGRFLICNGEDSLARIEVRRPKSPGEHPVAVLDDVKPGTRDLVVHVRAEDSPSAFVRGVIADENGKPVADANITLSMVPVVFSSSVSGVMSDTGTGAFKIGPVPAGTYRLGIAARGRVRPDLGARNLHKDEDVDLGVIRLQTAGSVCVKLTRAEGGPIGRPSLQASGADGEPMSLPLLGDRACNDTLASGRYTLVVCDEGGKQVGRSVAFDVVKGQQADLTFELPVVGKH